MVKPREGKEPGPELEGRWYKFMLDPAFLVSDPAAAAASGPVPAANMRLPFAAMHMRKPSQCTQVLAHEPTKVVNDAVHTPADAPPPGNLTAASEITPDESLEHVTGLVERLSFTGAASPMCEPPLPRDDSDTDEAHDVMDLLWDANEDEDWREVLALEECLEEVMVGGSDAACDSVLTMVSQAHSLGLAATGLPMHALAGVRLAQRRIEILGRMKRFRNQGELMCEIGGNLICLGRQPEAAVYFQRARDVGEDHGFISLECQACEGLGQLAMMEGRDEEAVLLLRNALVAAPLSEGVGSSTFSCTDFFELQALEPLCEALLKTGKLDELEPLVLRFREAGAARSRINGGFDLAELSSLYASARFYEVL